MMIVTSVTVYLYVIYIDLVLTLILIYITYAIEPYHQYILFYHVAIECFS